VIREVLTETALTVACVCALLAMVFRWVL